MNRVECSVCIQINFKLSLCKYILNQIIAVVRKETEANIY